MTSPPPDLAAVVDVTGRWLMRADGRFYGFTGRTFAELAVSAVRGLDPRAFSESMTPIELADPQPGARTRWQRFIDGIRGRW